MHNSAPFPKACRIHREHTVDCWHTINPPLEFGRLRGILTSCPLDPYLQFSQRYGGNEQTRFFHGADPCRHRPVRTHFSQFGDYVGIEQVLIHSNSTTGRLRSLPLSKVRSSQRGSGASNHSFKPGLAAFCSLSHSSIGTITAVLIPRRVTTCGPFLMVASRNSLNRAFASCTCHEAKFHLHVSL